MSQDRESPEIKVSDRRRFAADGQPLSGGEAEVTGKDSKQSSANDKELNQKLPTDEPLNDTAEHSDGKTTPALPPASFQTLVLSLAMQAQLELGFGSQDDKPPANIDLARHSIDMLDVLQGKTKGNLSIDENRLLENTLTELRFRYVQVVGEINKLAKK